MARKLYETRDNQYIGTNTSYTTRKFVKVCTAKKESVVFTDHFQHGLAVMMLAQQLTVLLLVDKASSAGELVIQSSIKYTFLFCC